MELIELLKKQERLREDYWKNVDYFLPIRLKWRAQMVRHLFHLFPENSILEIGSGSCQWTKEISNANKNQNPICAVTFNEELLQSTNNSHHPCTQCPSPGNHTASTSAEMPMPVVYPISSPRKKGFVLWYSETPPMRRTSNLISQARKALN